jgi:hypothetical protein
MEKQFSQVMLIGKEVVKRISKRATTSLFNFITKRDTGSFVISTSQDAYEGGNFTRAEAAFGVEWSFICFIVFHLLGRFTSSEFSVLPGDS